MKARVPLTIVVSLAAVSAFAQAPAVTATDTAVAEAWVEGKAKAESSRYVRSLLMKWRRPAVAPRVASCFGESGDPAGMWVGGHDPGGCLWLARGSDGNYSVRLLADTHHLTLKFIRRASVRGRVVELSGPVMDEELNGFDRLYLVTSGNAQWLIPEPTVEEVTGRVDKEGCSGLSVAWINGTLFTPASRDGADYCRAMLGLPER